MTSFPKEGSQIEGPFVNTDRELYREKSDLPCDYDNYYADSIHVTESGGIGINCGGHVIVAPLRKWHEAMKGISDTHNTERAEFCIYDGDDYFADVEGPREDAVREARHYAAQCEAPRIEEVTRRTVDLSGSTK